MLIKATLEEILKRTVSGTEKIKDNSICGKCSQCGECCSNFLPISQKECYRISNYVLEKNIRPQKHILVMQNRLACPYYDGKKCLIYDVRPFICKEFFCYKEPSNVIPENFKNEKYTTIDMWALVEEIEKMRKEFKNG